jgi:hypothetical protein
MRYAPSRTVPTKASAESGLIAELQRPTRPGQRKSVVEQLQRPPLRKAAYRVVNIDQSGPAAYRGTSTVLFPSAAQQISRAPKLVRVSQVRNSRVFGVMSWFGSSARFVL